jgi:hypothetical protein
MHLFDNGKENLQAKLSSVMKQLEAWVLNNDLIVNTQKDSRYVIPSLSIKTTL